MMSRIGGSVSGGNWKYAHGTAHYGQNFSLKWLKVIFHFLDLFLVLCINLSQRIPPCCCILVSYTDAANGCALYFFSKKKTAFTLPKIINAVLIHNEKLKFKAQTKLFCEGDFVTVNLNSVWCDEYFWLCYLQLCELSFQKTRHLRNPYNENLPVKV